MTWNAEGCLLPSPYLLVVTPPIADSYFTMFSTSEPIGDRTSLSSDVWLTCHLQPPLTQEVIPSRTGLSTFCLSIERLSFPTFP